MRLNQAETAKKGCLQLQFSFEHTPLLALVPMGANEQILEHFFAF